MSDLLDLSLADARDGLRKKAFTAVELTEAYLAAMDKTRVLNAYITETPDQARAMAAPKRVRDYAGALGETPVAWFEASLGGGSTAATGDGAPAGNALFAGTPAKGSLAHFRRCFPDDAALLALGS